MKREWERGNLRLPAWIAFFLVMLLGGYYRLYVVRWVAWGLVLALAALVVVAAAGLYAAAKPHEEGHEAGHADGPAKPGWIEVIVHFLPLLLFLVMGQTTLGRQAVSMEDPFAVSTQAAELKPIEAEKTEDGYFKLDVYKIYNLAQCYEESVPVEVVGMLHFLLPEDEKNLPWGVDAEDVRTLMFRYVMWCCANDARPATVVLAGKDLSGFEAGTWLKVKGGTLPPEGGLKLITIEVDAVEKIPQPRDPYLY